MKEADMKRPPEMYHYQENKKIIQNKKYRDYESRYTHEYTLGLGKKQSRERHNVYEIYI